MRNNGKISAALRTSALRPSATDRHTRTRCTINCSAPCEDITITVPPMTPIQRLNGLASEKCVLSQSSFPCRAATENTSLNPPSNSCGM